MKHILSIGLNDKDTKKQEITREQAINIIFKTCGDCSILDMLGGYTHHDGTHVIENGLQVTLYGYTDNQVKAFRDKLLIELNQEAIYIEKPLVELL